MDKNKENKISKSKETKEMGRDKEVDMTRGEGKIKELDKVKEKKKSKENEKEKSSQGKVKKSRSMAVLVVLVLIFGIAGFMFWRNAGDPTGKIIKDVYEDGGSENDGEEKETIVYNNFVFFRQPNNLWDFRYSHNEKTFDLTYHNNPYQVEDVPIEGEINKVFDNQPHYVTFNPLNDSQYISVSALELSTFFVYVAKQKMEMAYTFDYNEKHDGIPTVTCEDTNKSVIFLDNSKEETKVILKGNCIIIQGRERELFRATERLLYKWMKIMKE